jgi:hypothetical protein
MLRKLVAYVLLLIVIPYLLAFAFVFTILVADELPLYFR